MKLTAYRIEQYRSTIRRLRQQVFANPEIEKRNLIQKVKDHMGVHEGYSTAQLEAKERWAQTMWM